MGCSADPHYIHMSNLVGIEMNLEEVSESVMYSSLSVLKSNLRMNKLGMKHSAQKGKAIRPMVAEFLGLEKNAPYDDFINEVQKRMDAILAKRFPVKDSEAALAGRERSA